MRWGLVLAAALVMGVPVTAEAAPPDLVIEGSRSAYTDVVFERPLNLRDFQVQISGGGRFAGVAIESLDQRPAVQLAVLRAPGMSQPAVLPWMDPKPGRYRVRLLADAPARITLHLSEPGTGAVIRPTRPLATSLRTGRLDLLAGRSVAQLRFPGAVPAGQSALLVGQATGQRVEQSYACATASASCPSWPLAPPSPVPPVDPRLHPFFSDDEPRMTRTRPDTVARAALFGVEGVRAEPGVMTAAVVTFAP